jgi:hypothetical protein
MHLFLRLTYKKMICAGSVGHGHAHGCMHAYAEALEHLFCRAAVLVHVCKCLLSIDHDDQQCWDVVQTSVPADALTIDCQV